METALTQQTNAYFDDTYLTETAATVVASGAGEEGAWAAVSPNIFHPKGGGQPSDEGSLDGAPVTPVRTESGLVVLTGVASETEVGAGVVCRIDPELRRRHAALHTAGHILGHLGESRGWQHSGHSHFPGQARLDFEPAGHEDELASPELREAVRAEFQAQMDEVLARGGAVSSSVDPQGHRTVTIEGVSTEPCGGTHVRTLADLTGVRILEVKVKRGAIKVRYEAEHATKGPA
ncbi:alanyl-tRNA synthetase [Sinomonas notoginsengisoli]|uniref:hypothetical protein n=1 Tax=Sinomonas notoginsengisoli TaxID=1457311 RepID=UPI001F41B3D7|nr:hypothetical protein [Sinomonas notoginsengisoli]